MKTFYVILFFGIVAIATYEIVGPPVDIDPMHQTVTVVANVAVREIGAKYKLLKVISGTKQVVNGTLYNLEIVTKRKIKGEVVSGTLYNLEIVMKRKIKGEKAEKRRCRVLVYKIKAEDYLELEEFHCYFKEKEPTF